MNDQPHVSLEQLLNAKRELDQRIAQIQAADKATAIASIHALMRDHGVTLSDLGNRRGGPGKKRAGAGIPKYRDPATGKTWSGHGRRPAWFVEQDADRLRIAA